MTDDLLSGGMIIYSDVHKCPFCDDVKESLENGDITKEQGLFECRRCGGRYKVQYDDDQDIFIIEKYLK